MIEAYAADTPTNDNHTRTAMMLMPGKSDSDALRGKSFAVNIDYAILIPGITIGDYGNDADGSVKWLQRYGFAG